MGPFGERPRGELRPVVGVDDPAGNLPVAATDSIAIPSAQVANSARN